MLATYIFYESACIIDSCTCWIVGEWFVYIAVLQVCVDFIEVVSCVHYFIMQMLPPSSHGLMTEDWSFVGLFNADFFCNVRLL